jgi:hypothetical protein
VESVSVHKASEVLSGNTNREGRPSTVDLLALAI